MSESRSSCNTTLSTRFRDGDAEAECEILLRVFKETRRNVAARADRADDVFQDAMVVLLLRLRHGELNDLESARRFVHGVARRIEANLRRKDLRRRTSTSLDESAPVDPAPSALERLLVRERRSVVLEALATMHPRRDRLILYRLYILDHDREEVRDAFGLSASGFDRVLCRARARLRRLLAPDR